MLYQTNVAVFTLSNDKQWEPICNGQWIVAKIWTRVRNNFILIIFNYFFYFFKFK